ncbi:MAG: GTP cyclohydrolase, FolE2/MptA family [Kiritimatiellae bacterium]|nr:GTP cyclohydrolase, FolE2/MptA family [Kiritimatiellia bacterium]
MKSQQKKFLVDVGMRDLPFPIRVMSRNANDGQPTVAGISISARIMHEFEANWIDTFIQIVHQHRDRIGTATLKKNIVDYIKTLQASTVTVSFEFPFFYEKLTPVAREKCLVRYICVYTVKAHSVEGAAKATLRVNVPALTTYPMSAAEAKGGLFSQLSVITLDVEPRTDIFPEDIIDLVDKHALAPIYSFLTAEDQTYLIQKAHTENKPSVVVVDKIKDELAYNKNIEWYAVTSANYGMLHSYSTVIGTEKNLWVPFSGYDIDKL